VNHGNVWATIFRQFTQYALVNNMPNIEMTQHLYRFFPQIKHQTITVPAGSVAEVLAAVNTLAPGFTDYVLDDRGALRRHVNLSINDTAVIDKIKLTDRVPDDATVYIFQSLSGG
jgi:molybdopterin synthase sulfur carrier subunit